MLCNHGYARDSRARVSLPCTVPTKLLLLPCTSLQANGATRPVVRKKAALCLLRLIRKAPPDADIMQPEVGGRILLVVAEGFVLLRACLAGLGRGHRWLSDHRPMCCC